MTLLARVPLRLVERADDLGGAPPAPAGCFGPRRTMIDALLALDDESLARLRGVRSSAPTSDRTDIAVVLGPADALPWFDGVRYLGEAAPGLLVPTTRSLSVPAALAAAVLQRHLPAALTTAGIVPLKGALPLSRRSLRDARARARSAGEV